MTALSTIRPRAGIAALAAGAVLLGQAVAAGAAPADLPDMVEQVSPGVVTVMTVEEGDRRAFPVPEGSPFREFFERFGPDRMPEGRAPMRQGLGSGFVYDSDGLIVTNNHVVDGADRVRVQLGDGRTLDAEVVGTDAETDLALLKVESDAALPALGLGDSDALRIGESVFAVGNPFGLSTTVTSGILSATGRSMPGGNYVDFLQTDAAINRGNSGGPLFNMAGEVIGVNTAIYSPTGGNVGIGFAVPSNIVRLVVADLMDDGSVERGWLGVAIQRVTPEIAEAMGMERSEGALVSSVVEGSPSEGVLRPGDVILRFDGEPVESSRALPLLVGRTDPGREIALEVLRDGERRTITLTLGTLGERQAAAGSGSSEDPQTARLGARLTPLTPGMRARLDLGPGAGGAMIAGLDPAGAAARAGLRRGDVIEKVGPTTVSHPRDVARALETADADTVLFLVNRDGARLFVGVPLAS